MVCLTTYSSHKKEAPFIPEQNYDDTPLEGQGGFAESDRKKKEGQCMGVTPLWAERGGVGPALGPDDKRPDERAGERLGVDRLDYYGIESLKAQEITIADGRVPAQKARVIKTVDEISLIRQACAIADIALLGPGTPSSPELPKTSFSPSSQPPT